MSPRFADLSIKQKLLMIMMLTASVATVTACIAFAVSESIVYRRSVASEMNALADIVGRNSIGALEFNDPGVAEETLVSLSVDPQVVAAAIYTPDGKELAHYQRSGATTRIPTRPPRAEMQGYQEGVLVTFKRILFNGQHVGTVFISSDLSGLYTRLKWMLINMGVVMVGSVLMAFVFSTRLQRLVSDPIMDLVRTVKRVSRDRDYTLRARRQTEDELGTLIDGFNEMLTQIQRRDEDLQRAHDEMGARVEDRTKQLRQEIRVRRQAEQDLRKAHDELELRVEERTAQLADVNRSLRDEIGERKRAEAEIDARNRDLETLLYVTSHDLREPLRAIRNFSKIVHTRYADRIDEKGRDFLGRVVRATERLDRLIEDILTLSRAQRMDAQTDDVDGKEIVAEVLRRLEGSIEQRGATVRMAAEFPRFRVNKMWATQAVYNLVANALKFTRDGQPPTVEIAPLDRTKNGEREIGVMVSDEGPGVDPDQVGKIFGLFKRAVGREVEGTGAGLAIVRQIAERHGGRAWVEPRDGGGSIFVVTFGGICTLEGVESCKSVA